MHACVRAYYRYGIPERGRGWCVKDKVKKGFNKRVSTLFKSIKGATRRFLVLRGPVLYYFQDCELKVPKGQIKLNTAGSSSCAPSAEVAVSFWRCAAADDD